MEVDNGIVSLKSIVQNWQKAIKNNTVIPNDLCGSYYTGYWLNDIEGENYFLKISKKTGISKEIFIQIIGEELARMVGIETVHSKIVDVGSNTYGLMSSNYIKYDDNILSGKEIVIDYLQHLYSNDLLHLWLDTPLTMEEKEDFHDGYLEGMMEAFNCRHVNCNSLNFIWDALSFQFRNKENGQIITERIVKDLTKRYLFSFMIMNKDFHLKNWEIIDIYGNYTLSPLYDIDLSFDRNFTNLDKNNSMKSYENNIENIYEDFEQYFSSSSDDFKKEFYRQQNILTPENVQEAMERIINIYQNDNLKKYAEQILKVYIPHYEQMCSLAKGREL